MSLSNARRPRIPSAFMPPDWSPKSTSTVETSSPLGSSVEIFEYKPPASPSDTRSPTSSVRSTVAPPPDVFSAAQAVTPTSVLSQEGKAAVPSAKSIRTNLRELKARQAAIRRAKAGQDAISPPPPPPSPPAEPNDQPHIGSRPSSIRSSVAPPSDVFASPFAPAPPSSAQSDTASLRSMRNTLRGLKERQAARRQERESQRQAAEEVARILAEQHKNEMVRICKIEESTYEGRWEKLWKRSEDSLRHGSISTRGVERFLLSPFRKTHLTSKEKIEEELTRWERAAFEERVLNLVQESQRDGVRKGGEKVRAALKELLGRL